MRNRFVRGGGGVFTCEGCGRRCRLVDQPQPSRACTECNELAMQDNSVNDGAQTWDESRPYCEELLAAIVRKGGNADKAKRGLDYLWPKENSHG